MSCKKTLVAPGPNFHIWRNLISQMPSLLKLGFASRLFRRKLFYFPWSALFYVEAEIAWLLIITFLVIFFNFLFSVVLRLIWKEGWDRLVLVLICYFSCFFSSLVSPVWWEDQGCLIAWHHFDRVAFLLSTKHKYSSRPSINTRPSTNNRKSSEGQLLADQHKI